MHFFFVVCNLLNSVLDSDNERAVPESSSTSEKEWFVLKINSKKTGDTDGQSVLSLWKVCELTLSLSDTDRAVLTLVASVNQ